MQVVWLDWCVLRHFSATDVRIERSKRRSTNGHDHAEGHNRHPGAPGELRLGDCARSNGGHDPATAGKLAAPCGPQARAQRGPGPPLLPGKVRSHGSDRWERHLSFQDIFFLIKNSVLIFVDIVIFLNCVCVNIFYPHLFRKLKSLLWRTTKFGRKGWWDKYKRYGKKFKKKQILH